MALIGFVDDSVYVERLGSPQVANLLRVLFHSPDWAEAFIRLAGAQMNVLALPARDRELVILQTGYMLKAPYVVAQHEGISEVLGITEAQREALRGWGKPGNLFGGGKPSADRCPTDLFDDREAALLRLVTSLVQRTYPNDKALEDARAFFSEAELVEIVGVQGFAATVAGITLTFQVDVDPIAGDDLLRFANAVGDA
ncbi:carboxymuconolactone decarboxylase family protein [Sphingobium sp. PNB]|uniref:carboxymuconolactone decarboxylase family protein n=1 Tax=Sphingobium sp. PNB TaxID=863934 RepID=UPI001CA3AC4A|nr:carboxymuconolactone decarboxylase family protein [Sphingobium sp. PNB]MCB4858449.1 carboxymuconolactone decarboxylase family protein [Sphingobium sp. PNB]